MEKKKIWSRLWVILKSEKDHMTLVRSWEYMKYNCLVRCMHS